MRSTIVTCGLLAFALAGNVLADTRTTTAAVTVRKKAGEKEPALGTLAAGTEVEVVREEGRWVRIRTKKIEGYVTRTTLSDPIAPVTSAAVWSAPRRPNGVEVTDLFIQVTAATGTLRSAPKTDAPKVADVTRGGKLSVIDAASNPAWIHGRDEQGHDGWIARAEIDNGASGVAVTGVDLATSEPRGQLTRGALRHLAIRTDLGIGYRSLGMDLTSNAAGGLTNYVVDADAVAVTLDTSAIVRMSAPWFVAADIRGQFSSASPGIDYLGPTSPSGKIPFRTFGIDVGGRAGLRVKRAIDLSLGAGGHYDAFLTRAVDNAGMLPRERLAGLTLGAAAEITPLHSPFSATLRVDALVIGSRAQTPGLEDGTSNTAHAVWGGLTVRYLLGRHWAAFGAYEFGRASTSWSGMSHRQPGVTSAQRIDTTQLLQLGLSTEL